MTIINTVVLGIVCFSLATVAFDGLHYLLHRCAGSRWGVLRQLGELHQTHHRFLDASLNIQAEYIAANLRHHVVPEYLTQLLVTSLFLMVFPDTAVYFAWALETLVFVLILRLRGFDVNHRSIDQLAAYRPHFFCLPEYHALHHVFPDAHFSSWIKPLDYLLKTGISLKNRRISLVGPNSRLLTTLANRLREQGAVAEYHGSQDTLGHEHLEGSDILILCESELSGPERLSGLVESFSRQPRRNRAPREVWLLSSLLCAGACREQRQAWQRVCRHWFFSEQVVYRHLIIGSQPLSERQLNRLLSGIRRGFNLQVLSWRPAAWREALAISLPLGSAVNNYPPFETQARATRDKTPSL